MDILYWINLNPKVDIQATTKIFFKKYVCRMTMYCPGGRSIYDVDIEQSIENRQSLSRSINHGGSWYQTRRDRFLHESDIQQIADIKNLLDRKDIKVRVEEPYVQIYATDEFVLKEIVDAMASKSKSRISTLHVPQNAQQAQLLHDNKILRKSRRNTYRYKIVCRDGRVDPNAKKHLLNYFDSLGDMVMLPKCSRDMLESDYSGFWGVYFYSNDTSINTFVELIRPGIIANVHEIVVVK